MDQALQTLLATLLERDEQRTDAAAAIAAIGGAVPITVIWGAEDRVIPAAQAKAVAGAVRHLVDEAGRVPHTERPAQVLAAIEKNMARSA